MEAEIVQTLCNEGIIEYDDLENISGIDSVFVDKLIDFQSSDVPDLPPAQPLEEIKKIIPRCISGAFHHQGRHVPWVLL